MNKSHLVHAALREMIVAGDLAPGSAIDKAELALKLGASRQPVTSAIDRLAFEGLVDVYPQHGSFVSPLDPLRIADWFLIRAGIEAELAARLAADAPAGALADLERTLRDQAAALEAGDLPGFHRLDLAFHRCIAAHTDAPEALAILARAEANLGRVRRLLLPEPGRAADTLEEHRALFAAMRSGEPEAAAEAMRSHVATVARQFQMFLAQNPARSAAS